MISKKKTFTGLETLKRSNHSLLVGWRIEFQSVETVDCIGTLVEETEWHTYEIIQTASHLVFGGATNSAFLQSGSYLMDDVSVDENLAELQSDLETLHSDGARFVSWRTSVNR